MWLFVDEYNFALIRLMKRQVLERQRPFMLGHGAKYFHVANNVAAIDRMSCPASSSSSPHDDIPIPVPEMTAKYLLKSPRA
jgi:hypothetical protein